MENWNTTREKLRIKWLQIYPYLDERSRRIWAGIEAQQTGRGGKTLVQAATGMDWKTIEKGSQEASSKGALEPRLRRKGGGRKSLQATLPGLSQRLEDLIEPHTKGDPVRPLRWTSKSTYKLLNNKNFDKN